ncbi:MAG: ATP-binding cassette domain-containing protein, partial [Rhodothermaceae bacterium]|nr:ATP-binding cassette domain-containing protein [Rhodothermaceae bacterium]
MASVTFENVTKIYGNGHLAVDQASFTVADGELMVLVGPSGCGKSTTLRMLAGLESVTQGLISIDDVVVNEIPPKDRDVAMVFQNYALYPH